VRSCLRTQTYLNTQRLVFLYDLPHYSRIIDAVYIVFWIISLIQCNSSIRNCHAFILWHHNATLLLRQSLDKIPSNHEIHVSCLVSTFREFCLYLSWRFVFAQTLKLLLVTLFLKTDERFHIILIIITLAFCMLARYASVIPLASLINWMNRRFFDKDYDTIPRNHQLMLWWAGLRGAIAFALSFDVEGEAGGAIRTTVLVVCVVSIITLGGSTNYALERLKIRTGVGNRGEGGDDASDGDTDSSCSEESEGGDEEGDDAAGPHWFTDFDARYLKPVFCRYRQYSLNSKGTVKRREMIGSIPRRES
jgi:hypothetical protein